MGDRGNIVIRQGDTNRDDVWFYTHWCGTEIKETVAKALVKRLRWTDPSYLARIMFDALTDGQTGSETGFGISSKISDNEHPIVVLDCPNQKVWVIEEEQLVDDRLPNTFKPAKVFTSEGWIAKHLAPAVKVDRGLAVACGLCKWIGWETQLARTLAETPDLLQRIEPGGTVPAGECPKCGGLCYPARDYIFDKPIKL